MSIGWPEKIFARAVDEPQAAIGIEGENGHVDFRHDRAEQRCRFKSAQALEAESFAERVDFKERFAERIIGPGAACADRVIAFPQRREQVRHRLQGPHDVFPRIQDEAETGAGDHERQRPLDLGGVIAKPEQDQRDDRGGRRGPDGQPGNASLVGDPLAQLFEKLHPQTKQPTRLPLQLKSILLQPAIERAPAQPEGLCRLAGVAIKTRERLLDQERFHFLEAHVFQPGRVGHSAR